MWSLRRYREMLATMVLPLCTIAAVPTHARSQASARSDTMAHVRADTATLEAQRRRAVSSDLAVQYRLDSTADASRCLGAARRGVYYGLAGGLSQPITDFRAGYNTAWNVTVPVAWYFAETPFGIRADASWGRLRASPALRLDSLGGTRQRDAMCGSAHSVAGWWDE
jgi:hypothetical protein